MPVSGGAHDTRLRLAVLSDWDGVTWHVDADYRNAGRVLPPVPPPPGHEAEGSADLAPPLTVEERITVAELQGRLMPAVSAPAPGGRRTGRVRPVDRLAAARRPAHAGRGVHA